MNLIHTITITINKNQLWSILAKKYPIKLQVTVLCRINLKIYGGIWIPKIILKISWKNNVFHSLTELLKKQIDIDYLYWVFHLKSWVLFLEFKYLMKKIQRYQRKYTINLLILTSLIPKSGRFHLSRMKQ